MPWATWGLTAVYRNCCWEMLPAPEAAHCLSSLSLCDRHGMWWVGSPGQMSALSGPSAAKGSLNLTWAIPHHPFLPTGCRFSGTGWSKHTLSLEQGVVLFQPQLPSG